MNRRIAVLTLITAAMMVAAVTVPLVLSSPATGDGVAERSDCPDLAAAVTSGGEPEGARLGCPAEPMPEVADAGADDGVGEAASLLLEPLAIDTVEVLVYTTPTCGCCHQWIEIMKREGFRLRIVEVTDILKVKDDLGVSRDIVSCHTAVAAGYFLEGHVPPDAIRKLLTRRPDVRGLAVAGMPDGAPGMGGTPGGYDVLVVGRDGSTRVFAHY